MARRAFGAAAAWMIRRQNTIQGGNDPVNPDYLPEYVIGNAALFYSAGAAITFSLFLTDSLVFDLDLASELTGAVALGNTFIHGH